MPQPQENLQTGLSHTLRLAIEALKSVGWVHFAEGDQSDCEGLFCPWCGAGKGDHYGSCLCREVLARLEDALESEIQIETELARLATNNPVVHVGLSYLRQGMVASKRQGLLTIIKALIDANTSLQDLLTKHRSCRTIMISREKEVQNDNDLDS